MRSSLNIKKSTKILELLNFLTCMKNKLQEGIQRRKRCINEMGILRLTDNSKNLRSKED